VDLTWPLAEEDARTPRQAAASRAPGAESRRPEPAPVAARQEELYAEAIGPVHERVTAVQPFLMSAARSGSVEVLAALDQTLADLESALVGMSVPLAQAGQHQLLISATRVARRGLEPGFTGDRQAHAQKAIAMFEGAMAPSTTPAEP
jgi:hypothetical protein